jgi:hypothetical protein
MLVWLARTADLTMPVLDPCWKATAYDKLVSPLSQLFDVFCSRLFGKNAVIYARKPAHSAGLETTPAPAGT